MTWKEKIELVKGVSHSLRQLSSQMQALALEGLELDDKALQGKCNMSQANQDGFITQYQSIKAAMQAKFQELP